MNQFIRIPYLIGGLAVISISVVLTLIHDHCPPKSARVQMALELFGGVLAGVGVLIIVLGVISVPTVYP